MNLLGYLTHASFEQVLANAEAAAGDGRTCAVRDEVHQVIARIIDRGRADGSITRDVSPRDIVVSGRCSPSRGRPTRAGTRPAAGSSARSSRGCRPAR